MRCIFLRLDGLDPAIERFREVHDPQANLVEPHVTLVFPFESDIPDGAIEDHALAVARDAEPFAISLGSANVNDDYLYLPVLDGCDTIRALHDRLYTGLLEAFLVNIPYIPHVTIGRAAARADMARLCAEAGQLDVRSRIRVTTMMLERIGDSGESIPIARFSLGQGAPHPNAK